MCLQCDASVKSDNTIFIKGFPECSLRILKCNIRVMNRYCAVLLKSVNHGLCSVTSEC